MKKTLVVLCAVFTIGVICYASITSLTKASGNSYSYEHYYDNESLIANSDKLVVLPNEDNPEEDAYITPEMEYDSREDQSNGEANPMSNINSNQFIDESGAPWSPATELDLDPQSITVFVNKEYALPKKYVPSDMVVPNIVFDFNYYSDKKLLRAEAATALEKLFNDSKNCGFSLFGISGYRSYGRQYQIFRSNLLKKGKYHTLRYSAIPGTSEHQTGLSIDVSTSSIDNDLIGAFIDTPEGRWLERNAHLYGYIIRYPEDKTEITGYSYEPWHIRYVGKALAYYLYNNNLCLEEYYNYTPSNNFDYETTYAELLVIPTPVPLPTDILDPAVGEDPLDPDASEEIIDEEGSLEEELISDLPDGVPVDPDEEQPTEQPEEDPIEQPVEEPEGEVEKPPTVIPIEPGTPTLPPTEQSDNTGE